MTDTYWPSSEVPNRDKFLSASDVTNDSQTPIEQWQTDVRLRSKQHQELVYALGIQSESLVRSQREQTEAIKQGFDDVVASNYEIERAIEKWGAETSWRLDTINDNLTSISGALANAVDALQRPNETASREKWRDAQDAWLDKRFNRARELYSQAIEMYDALSPASFQLGNLLLTEFRDLDAAKKAFQLAVDTATRRLPSLAALAHYNLYLIHEQKGELEQAKRELDAALSLQPNMANAWWDSAVLSVRLSDAEEVKRTLTKSIQADPLFWYRATSDPVWGEYHELVQKRLDHIFNVERSRFQSELARLLTTSDKLQSILSELPKEMTGTIRSDLNSVKSEFYKFTAATNTDNLLNFIEAVPYMEKLRMRAITALRSALQVVKTAQAATIKDFDDKHYKSMGHEMGQHEEGKSAVLIRTFWIAATLLLIILFVPWTAKLILMAIMAAVILGIPMSEKGHENSINQKTRSHIEERSRMESNMNLILQADRKALALEVM